MLNPNNNSCFTHFVKLVLLSQKDWRSTETVMSDGTSLLREGAVKRPPSQSMGKLPRIKMSAVLYIVTNYH